MNKIYLVHINSNEDYINVGFTTLEKAIKFIKEEHKIENPKKLFDDYYEGKYHTFTIEDLALDEGYNGKKI